MPIIHHQAVSFMLSDMAIGTEAARLAYIKSAWQADNKIMNTYMASIAKCRQHLEPRSMIYNA